MRVDVKRMIVYAALHPYSAHLESPEDCDTFGDRRLRNEIYQLNRSAAR